VCMCMCVCVYVCMCVCIGTSDDTTTTAGDTTTTGGDPTTTGSGVQPPTPSGGNENSASAYLVPSALAIIGAIMVLA
jgi:hypothetical protein